MKSPFGADAPPDPLHKSQASVDSHSLGFALTAGQAQLNALFAGVAEAIVLVDEEGEVQRINPAFTRVFGYSEGDAVGQPLGALIALDDPLEELETHTSTASAQNEVVIPEAVRRRDDGTRIPVSFVKVPVRSPRTANCWYLIYRDLTERKRLEDELSREHDRLRLLLEITHSMTSKLDLRQLIAVLSMDLLSVMQCDFCALLLPDADSGELRVTTLYNPEARGALCDGTIIPIHGSICGKAFWTGKTQHYNHFEEVR
jgi:PAS domain S-box-containing protein